MMDEKFFCRNCRGLRNHKKIHEVKKQWSSEYDYFQWYANYSIIECLGCETVSFLQIYGDTDMVAYNDYGHAEYLLDKTIYPYYLEEGEEIRYTTYIPESIRAIYRETISAFKANLSILTAGGLRAIIEAICNHLKIQKGNLGDRIDLLHSKGHLTMSESKRLHSIRFIGNDALHEISKPKKEHLFILLEIVNHLLENLFINDKKLNGKLDMMIDTYEDFLKILELKVSKDMIGKDYTIDSILAKSKRLVHRKNYQSFETNLKEDIRSGKIDYISIVDESKEAVYRIEKEPVSWF